LWVNKNEHRWVHSGERRGGVTLNDFRSNLFANLIQIRAELLGGTYRAGPFRKVSIPKKKPGYRILTIPSVRDRVVHTSIANALTPLLEPHFEDSSFAYRPNRGVIHAVQRIESWRKRGYTIVVEADIVSYFDNIDQEILLDKIKIIIGKLPGSAALIALVAGILKDQAHALGTLKRGLVQGSPLSPLLANLYLDALDEEIEDQGVKIVRFADDFVILCKTHAGAEKALTHCVKVLAAHGLRLHEDGTRIVSFDQGFDFIGYLFVRTLALKQAKSEQALPSGKPVKSLVTDEGIIELEDNGSRFDPGKRVLYVLDPNHKLTTRNRSFSVLREDDTELIAIPHQRVGRIEVGPTTEFSRRPVDLAIESGIVFAMIDGFGQTKGIATAGDQKRAALQMSQAKCVLDSVFRCTIARRLVDARIRNQRTQLRRLVRGHSMETSALTGMDPPMLIFVDPQSAHLRVDLELRVASRI
jgi:CRISPR-associated protein Cas1